MIKQTLAALTLPLILFLQTCNVISDNSKPKATYRLNETISIGGLSITPFNSEYPEIWPDYLTIPSDTYLPGFGVITKSGQGYTANCYRRESLEMTRQYFESILKQQKMLTNASLKDGVLDIAGEDEGRGLKVSIYSIPNSSSVPKEWTHFFIHIEPKERRRQAL